MASIFRKIFGSDEPDYGYDYQNDGSMAVNPVDYQQQYDQSGYQPNNSAPYMQSVPPIAPSNPNITSAAPNNGGITSNPMMQASTPESHISLIEPKVFSDAKAAAQQLIYNEAVIVNLSSLDTPQTQRVIDFLSGAIYSLGGSFERIATDTYLVTPKTFEVTGAMSQNITENSQL